MLWRCQWRLSQADLKFPATSMSDSALTKPISSGDLPPGSLGLRKRFVLSSELGFVYDKTSKAPPLVYPMFLDFTVARTILIVDRCCPTNVVWEINFSGEVIFEYRGIARLGSAQRLDNGLTLLLDRGANALVRVDECGRTISRQHLPNPLPPDTVLQVDDSVVITAGDDGLKWLNENGDLLNRIAPAPGFLVEPRDIQTIDENRVLITDIELCQVMEMDMEGHVLWKYGTPHRLDGVDRLYSPNSACRTRDGHTIVANTRAHQLLDIAPNGKLVRAIDAPRMGHGFGSNLIAPSFVRELPNDNLIVADTGNRRVLEVTRQGKQVWSYGHSGIVQRQFSFPRMAHALPEGQTLVCDSYNDRVVEVNSAGQITWVFGGREGASDNGLRIPRAARMLPTGNVLIADGVNQRLLEVNRRGEVVNEIQSFQHRGETKKFLDPHDVVVHDSAIVIADADLGQVIYLNYDYTVRRVWPHEPGERCVDPHQINFIGKDLLLADSGNNRIARIDEAGRCLWSCDFVRSQDGEGQSKLRYPRGVASDAGEILIVDTENVRVLGVGLDFLVHWSYGPILDFAPHIKFPAFPEIRAMKRLEVIGARQHLLTDFLNNRIITLTCVSSPEIDPLCWQRADKDR